MESKTNHFTRRHFLRNAAAASVMAGFGGLIPSYARSGKKALETDGTIDLIIDRKNIAIGGRRTTAIAINGSVPGPLVRLREGEEAVIRVTNLLEDSATSIHWHGLMLPFRMDGVPGVSFAGIAPMAERARSIPFCLVGLR
jgi:FtsP/CotA-like multicopper oxidase with cupredoxin domain